MPDKARLTPVAALSTLLAVEPASAMSIDTAWWTHSTADSGVIDTSTDGQEERIRLAGGQTAGSLSGQLPTPAGPGEEWWLSFTISDDSEGDEADFVRVIIDVSPSASSITSAWKGRL